MAFFSRFAIAGAWRKIAFGKSWPNRTNPTFLSSWETILIGIMKVLCALTFANSDRNQSAILTDTIFCRMHCSFTAARDLN